MVAMGYSSGVSESFKKRADSSAYFEAWVGAMLARSGLYTLHHPFNVASSKDQFGQFAHTWDLDVSSDKRIFTPTEVKSVNLTFNSVDEYPYDSVLVCSEKSFLNKWPGGSQIGRDFLLVSRYTGALVWIPKGSWVGRHKTYDHDRGESFGAMRTSKENLRSMEDFVAHIKTIHLSAWSEPSSAED